MRQSLANEHLDVASGFSHKNSQYYSQHPHKRNKPGTLEQAYRKALSPAPIEEIAQLFTRRSTQT